MSIQRYAVLFCVFLAIASATANIVCTSSNIGRMFPAESKRQYLVCEWAGFPPTLMNCALGTYFVEANQRCDALASSEDNGGGDGGDGGGPGGPGGPGEEDEPPTTTNTPCPPCNPILDSGENGPGGPGEPVYCEDNGFICESSGGRLYPNPNDPASYFLCPHFEACSVLMPCAPGTIFHENLQRCDW